MEQIFHEAGFPKDAYINIYATNEQIEWVIADPRVRGVSLTGSERAGAAVAEIAGRNLKKVVLELGGSDPFILLAPTTSTPPSKSAVGGAAGEHRPGVQRRQAVHRRRRALRAVPGEVHRGADRGEARRSDLAGDDDRPAVLLDGDRATGRPGQARGRRRARSWSPAAATTATSFEPTVLTDIKPDNDAYREEFFGPVALGVSRRRTRTRRCSWPTTRRSASGSYVMTNDSEQALRVADKIDAGMVFVNARRRRGRRAAVRRRQALGLRPRARPLRRRRVRQQEADPRGGLGPGRRGRRGQVNSPFEASTADLGDLTVSHAANSPRFTRNRSIGELTGAVGGPGRRARCSASPV